MSLDIKTSSLEHEATILDHKTSLGLICSLVSNNSLCLSCLAYNECTQARLQPGLSKDGRPQLIAEMLHVHLDEVRAYSLAQSCFKTC